jgi:fimbrial isopeptide formation D2 family protein
MKKFKRGYLVVVALISLVALFSTSSQPAQAAESDVSITLHKLLFESGETPAATINDGETNPFADQLSTSYTGLNGVTFRAYDVTSAFYNDRSKDKKLSVKEEQEKLATKAQKAQLTDTLEETLGKPIQSVTTATQENEDGLATFTLPATETTGKHRDSVYVFVETAKPTAVKVTADPMVVVLPVQGEDGQDLTAIHLYPKNEEVSHKNPPLKKVVTAADTDFAYGASVPYKITTVIPDDVWSYDNYQIIDHAAGALNLDTRSLLIQVDGHTLTDEATIETTTHGFTITLDGAKLKSEIGKTLTVTYEMTLTGSAPTQSSFDNQVTLVPGNYPKIVTHTPITTGGKQFVKVDLQGERLSGAEFVVRNKAGDYLSRDGTGNAWQVVKSISEKKATAAKLAVLTSDSNGHFEINGLAYGTYYLTEIKAPADYVMSSEAVKFTVEKGSYELGATTALNIVNKPESPSTPSTPGTPSHPSTPETPGDNTPGTSETPPSGETTTTTSTRRPRLPSTFGELAKRVGQYVKTNEAVHRGLMIVGFVIIAFVIIFVIKRRRKDDKGE